MSGGGRRLLPMSFFGTSETNMNPGGSRSTGFARVLDPQGSLPPDPFLDDPSFSDPSQNGTQTNTALLERTETEEQVEPGDHERFAHYVRKAKIMESALSGKPVIALCGKVWVPGRDPNKFPVCPICKEIYDGLRDPQDDNPDSGGDSK